MANNSSNILKFIKYLFLLEDKRYKTIIFSCYLLNTFNKNIMHIQSNDMKP